VEHGLDVIASVAFEMFIWIDAGVDRAMTGGRVFGFRVIAAACQTVDRDC
jgi:hypothetical protein